MQYIKSSLGSLLWIMTKLCSNFFINKMVSVTFGPQGIALLSQFLSYFSVVALLSNDGINKGVVKYLADKEQTFNFRSQVFSVGILLNIILFIGVVIISIFFLPSLTAFFSVSNPTVWIVATLSLLGLMLVQYYVYSIFLAEQRLMWYNAFNIAGALLIVPLVYVSCKSWGLAWTLTTVAFGSIVTGTAAFFLLFFRERKLYSLNLDTKNSKPIVQKLMAFVWIACGVLIFGKLTEIGIRQVALQYYPTAEVGLWQTAVKISDYYTTAFTTLLSIIYFPQLASLLSDSRALKQFVLKLALWLLPLSLVGLAVIYLFREIFITTLFSPDFLRAEQYIGIQVLTDALKFASYLLVFLLTAQSRTLDFLILEALSAAIYLILALFFSKYMQMELYGLMVAQLFRYVFYLSYLLILYRKLFLIRK